MQTTETEQSSSEMFNDQQRKSLQKVDIKIRQGGSKKWQGKNQTQKKLTVKAKEKKGHQKSNRGVQKPKSKERTQPNKSTQGARHAAIKTLKNTDTDKYEPATKERKTQD